MIEEEEEEEEEELSGDSPSIVNVPESCVKRLFISTTFLSATGLKTEMKAKTLEASTTSPVRPSKSPEV
jgi:hypothetical protein